MLQLLPAEIFELGKVVLLNFTNPYCGVACVKVKFELSFKRSLPCISSIDCKPFNSMWVNGSPAVLVLVPYSSVPVSSIITLPPAFTIRFEPASNTSLEPLRTISCAPFCISSLLLAFNTSVLLLSTITVEFCSRWK